MSTTENEKSNIEELKNKINTKTLNMVLLAIVTGGIYLILWMYKNYPIIDDVTKTKTTNETYIIFIAVAVGLGATFSSIPIPFTMLIGNLLPIVSFVLYVMWSFKVKKSLESYTLNEFKIDLRMNTIYIVIFNIYYINYIINDLPEEARKQDILKK